MAESSKAGSYEALPAVSNAGEERWPAPRTAMFVAFTSTALWIVILAGARWLIG
jgi:hypothetical protein